MRGSSEQALVHLENLHAIAPAWAEVLSMLAETHRQIGNRQQAQALFAQREYQLKQTALIEQQLTRRGDVVENE